MHRVTSTVTAPFKANLDCGLATTIDFNAHQRLQSSQSARKLTTTTLHSESNNKLTVNILVTLLLGQARTNQKEPKQADKCDKSAITTTINTLSLSHTHTHIVNLSESQCCCVCTRGGRHTYQADSERERVKRVSA